jgi:hypothetical protein
MLRRIIDLRERKLGKVGVNFIFVLFTKDD